MLLLLLHMHKVSLGAKLSSVIAVLLCLATGAACAC